MAYEYDYDQRDLGSYNLRGESLRLIQAGLQELLQEVFEWSECARKHGATPPYEREVADLQGLISYGDRLLESDQDWVRLGDISVGTGRYLKAGLELSIRRRRADLEANRLQGWPTAVLREIETSIQKLQEVASLLEVQPSDLLWEVLPQEETSVLAEEIREQDAATLWDVFVCHASEDKERFARPLAQALSAAGLRVWYDELSLRIGDSLRRSIDSGLSRSRYGVVVLSPSFFAKEWPQTELDGLVARELDGNKLILPVWHNIELEEVRRHSPTLADRVAAKSKDGLDAVVSSLLGVVQNARS